MSGHFNANAEVCGIAWARPCCSVSVRSVGDPNLILSYQRVVEPVEAVDVAHHASGAVDKCEVIAKQFLGDAAYLVDVTRLVEEFLQGTAIAHPVEVASPDVLSVLSDGSPSCDGFPDEGVECCSRSEHRQDPKRTGRRRALDMSSSNLFGPPLVSKASAARDASSSAGCVTIKDIPVFDQSVFRKIGRASSKRARQGSFATARFISWNRSRRGWVHREAGIDRLWNSLVSSQRGRLS